MGAITIDMFEVFEIGMQDMMKEVHRNAVEKGWWDTDRNDGECIALMHSELSEALEALRGGDDCLHDNVGEELADCVIRIMDYCQKRGIDLGAEIVNKHIINQTRPRKHGGKRF